MIHLLYLAPVLPLSMPVNPMVLIFITNADVFVAIAALEYSPGSFWQVFFPGSWISSFCDQVDLSTHNTPMISSSIRRMDNMMVCIYFQSLYINYIRYTSGSETAAPMLNICDKLCTQLFQEIMECECS